MTGEQKNNIQTLRRQGMGISQIADSLGLSVNTIKSFCRRNNLPACDASNDTGNEENKELCKYCGRRLQQTPNAKPKRFCSDACRYAWWNTRREQMNRKAVYQLTCAHCGKTFDSYGNKNRKYCGHSCYIADRFGKSAVGKEACHEQGAI